MTILVVEDDVMNRDMLTRRLAWEGYHVITAADGAQAVALAKAERPALILMDLGLPIMDGWQATRQIKAEAQPPLIIALTAFAMAEDRAKALAAGCDDFESKPVEFRRLLPKMRRLLGIAAP